MISAVSSLYKSLPKPEERARYVVTSLARAVLSQLDDQSHDVASLAFHTISDWVQVDQWILHPDAMESLNMLLEAIVCVFKARDNGGSNVDPSTRRRGILPKVPHNAAQEDILEAAELALSTLLNELGHWPGEGPERVCCWWLLLLVVIVVVVNLLFNRLICSCQQ